MKHIEIDTEPEIAEPELVPTFEAFEALEDDEIGELIERHAAGDAGEFPDNEQSPFGFESVFTVRGIKVVIHTLTDGSRRFLSLASEEND